MKFNYFVDRKVEVWLREHFSVEANSQEEANLKAVSLIDKDFSPEVISSEVNYESLKVIEPEETAPTSILFTDDGDEVWDNE